MFGISTPDKIPLYKLGKVLMEQQEDFMPGEADLGDLSGQKSLHPPNKFWQKKQLLTHMPFQVTRMAPRPHGYPGL